MIEILGALVVGGVTGAIAKENEELSRSLKEHKQACDSYEIEIKNLKEKLG